MAEAFKEQLNRFRVGTLKLSPTEAMVIYRWKKTNDPAETVKYLPIFNMWSFLSLCV